MSTPELRLEPGTTDKDHVAAVMRMRQVLIAGTIMWVSALGIDWVMSHRVAPGGAFRAMVVIRGAETVVLLVVLGWLRRQPVPGPAPVRTAWLIVFIGAGAAQGGFTVALGQIASPYAHGASVVVVAAGLATPDHWRRGLRVLGPAALAYPTTILLAGLGSPTIAQRLTSQVDLLAFAVDVTVLAMATALLIAVGHASWALRRELFEARRLGGYRLKSRIAVGGMGEVWRAWHGALKRDVAVKILRLDLADPAAAARFEREAAATAALTHPNTVRVLDYGVTEDGLSYYAMELLDGITLQTLVDRDGPLAPERAVHLLIQAASALAEAHRGGLVHRDVKPSNLLVTTTGGQRDFVKLIDFGIARAGRGDHAATLTGDGRVMGTPAYMAPEQVSGAAVDARTDVYALGAVAYFALTGRPVFDGATPEAVLAAHLDDQPTALAARVPAALPGELDALVMRCLRKHPGQRYADGDALVDALVASGLAGAWVPARAGTARRPAPAGAEATTGEPTVSLDRPT